jgi:transcriptional regulator with XRE-family HTH domain
MNMEIANRLCEIRKKKGLSQEALAEHIGVSRQAISKWERAESSPDIETLIHLAQLYNVTLDELVSPNESNSQLSTQENGLVIPVDYEAMRIKKKKALKSYLFCFPVPHIIALLYLFVGFVWGAWHPGWLMLLVIPIYYSAVAVM